MQVTQCDRCGRIVENKATLKLWEFEGQKVEREYDLCQDCCNKVMKFLKGEPE